MARKRIGIVGLGMAHKPHVQSLRDLADRAEIAACYTPSAERRDSFGREHPDLSITDSLERVLADKSIDAVILLTPPTTHADLVQRCAAAGKHVLLEKPLEVSVERALPPVDAMETRRAALRRRAAASIPRRIAKTRRSRAQRRFGRRSSPARPRFAGGARPNTSRSPAAA